MIFEDITKSATKIVLLLLVLGLLVFTFIGSVDQEVFKTVILMVISFYFGQKVNVPIESEKVEITGKEIDK